MVVLGPPRVGLVWYSFLALGSQHKIDPLWEKKPYSPLE